MVCCQALSLRDAAAVICCVRLQHHQGELETQKARNDLARIQEEHNRLVTEGDDLVELQSKRHELRLK